MVCETTRNYVIKVNPLKTVLNVKLSLFLVLFGVCSVSLDAFSYPASIAKSSYLTSNSSQTVKLTRSARESSKSESIASRGPLAPGTHNLSLGVGQIFLLGDVANTSYENAIGTELHYTYGVSELFGFESNFGYSSHSGGNLSMYHLSAGLRTNLIYFDQIVPFFNFGLGFYHPSATLTNNATLSALLFGLQLGGGVDLLISQKVFFGSRLTFHDMFSSSKADSNGLKQDIGGSFMSFMIHVGYNFN
jgi:hypothetical protein